jgi:hypothetical protein
LTADFGFQNSNFLTGKGANGIPEELVAQGSMVCQKDEPASNALCPPAYRVRWFQIESQNSHRQFVTLDGSKEQLVL